MKKTLVIAAAAAAIMTLATATYAAAAPNAPLKTDTADVTVMPGNDSVLHLHFAGAALIVQDFRNSRGGLTVFKANGARMHYQPIAYQLIDGKLKLIEAEFHIEGKDRVTVQFARLNNNAPVILKRGAVVDVQPVGL